MVGQIVPVLDRKSNANPRANVGTVAGTALCFFLTNRVLVAKQIGTIHTACHLNLKARKEVARAGNKKNRVPVSADAAIARMVRRRHGLKRNEVPVMMLPPTRENERRNIAKISEMN